MLSKAEHLVRFVNPKRVRECKQKLMSQFLEQVQASKASFNERKRNIEVCPFTFNVYALAITKL
jgi:hypothetical protein